MTTSNLDFTSGTESTNGPNVPKGIDYTLPASLAPSYSTTYSTSIGTPTGSIPIAASANVTAGLTGGIDLTLGTYTPNIPVTVNVDVPTSVADGATFTVDPTLVSTNDASFSLTGPGAYIALDLAIQGSVGFSFNKGALIEPSFAVTPSFSIGYNLPTSLMISSSKVPGVSLTLSEPMSFSTNSTAGTAIGSIPTLTASGTDSTALISATADLIHLALDVASSVPGLEELALLDGTYGSSGFASLSYSLISLPLTASLDVGQSVTIVPQTIQVAVTDELNDVTDTGTLGQSFSFTAPSSGSGTIPLQTNYTLPIEVETQTGVVGELSLTLKGPQLQGSLLDAGFTVGPVGSYQFFDLSTGLGTIASSNFTQSLTTSETYDVNYGANTPCYLAGTRILTERGQVAVEQLTVGDRVVTASGDLRPVRWLGSRRLDCTRHPAPAEVWPICIAAGAFAPRRPERDLWVSPGHSVLVDGALVQASNLVNGATIVQVRPPRVEYWHVELDAHDCLVAEGLPAESYLDTGNRTAFVNGGDFLEAYPDFKPKHFRETCLPLVEGGPAIVKARSDLMARAVELGYRMTGDMDLHLVADGRRIDGARIGDDRWAFLLNEAAEAIELRSRVFVPAQMQPTSSDTRTLGVCVGRLQLDGVDAALDNAAVFGEGWHKIDRGSCGREWRWTSGRTPLPMRTRLVVVDLSNHGSYWEKTEISALTRMG